MSVDPLRAVMLAFGAIDVVLGTVLICRPRPSQRLVSLLRLRPQPVDRLQYRLIGLITALIGLSSSGIAVSELLGSPVETDVLSAIRWSIAAANFVLVCVMIPRLLRRPNAN